MHLGRDDMAVADARAALGRRALIGVSCYDNLARARDGAERGCGLRRVRQFLSVGREAGSGARATRAAARCATAVGLPIVAIGGITPENAVRLVEAGADAVAVISALFQVTDSCARRRKRSLLLFQVQDEPLSIDSDR